MKIFHLFFLGCFICAPAFAQTVPQPQASQPRPAPALSAPAQNPADSKIAACRALSTEGRASTVPAQKIDGAKKTITCLEKEIQTAASTLFNPGPGKDAFLARLNKMNADKRAAAVTRYATPGGPQAAAPDALLAVDYYIAHLETILGSLYGVSGYRK
jgi:hypothetical protein